MESERGEMGEGNNIMPNGNIILKESEEEENCGKRLLKLICHCPLLIHIFFCFIYDRVYQNYCSRPLAHPLGQLELSITSSFFPSLNKFVVPSRLQYGPTSPGLIDIFYLYCSMGKTQNRKLVNRQ